MSDNPSDEFTASISSEDLSNAASEELDEDSRERHTFFQTRSLTEDQIASCLMAITGSPTLIKLVKKHGVALPKLHHTDLLSLPKKYVYGPP